MLVLQGQQAVEALGNAVPQIQHRAALDAQRRAGAKVHNLGEPCCGRRAFTSECSQQAARLVLCERRQRVKQRHVGGKLVALLRIVRATQTIGVGLQRRGQLGRDDQRRGIAAIRGIFMVVQRAAFRFGDVGRIGRPPRSDMPRFANVPVVAAKQKLAGANRQGIAMQGTTS